MANWYYYDNGGTKQGPFTDSQLTSLAAQGIVIPQTQVEYERDGKANKRITAGQVKGLFPDYSGSSVTINWYYYDNNGEKQGLITHEALKDLAANGVITPQTRLETESGKQGIAGQIKGLIFPANPYPGGTAKPKEADLNTVSAEQASSFFSWFFSWLFDFGFKQSKVMAFIHTIACIAYILSIIVVSCQYVIIVVLVTGTLMNTADNLQSGLGGLILLILSVPVAVCLYLLTLCIIRLSFEWIIYFFDWMVDVRTAANHFTREAEKRLQDGDEQPFV
ncbi:MAG: DUF4339 domain-containing protein [Planctomycetaceae bacterium]|jgi:hypothetical protein|nr:DUF4339 domain-containing protein [Planctomycetaceae bacterium]